jgi:uncharacterized protein (TIGR03032 family)
MSEFAAVELRDFETVPSDGFVAWLDEVDVALAVTHANKVVTLGRHGDDLLVRAGRYDQVTALAAGDAGELWLGLTSQLWRLENAVPGGSDADGVDHRYVPRVGSMIGRALPVDIAVTDQGVCIASAALSCLARPDPLQGLVPLWAPPFVRALTADVRCGLSGVAVRDGRPSAVTCHGATDAADAWRAARADGGVVVDVDSNEIVAHGLSVPQSPRWHDGHLWFVQSGTGTLGYLDGEELVEVVRVDGYVQALCFAGGHAVVGTSGSRWDELVAGLPVGERLAGRRPLTGVFVVDLRRGEVVHEVRFDGTAREIADIVAIPTGRHVEFASPDGLHAQELVTYPVPNVLAT